MKNRGKNRLNKISNIGNIISVDDLKNFFIVPSNINLSAQKGSALIRTSAGGSQDPVKNLSNTLVPIQLPRIRQDIQNWRSALDEAEQAYFPYRVIMQQMYIDVANDPHVDACWNRRKSLTLLRKFAFYNGDVINEAVFNLLDKEWLYILINHILDALAYGYSLISLGDIIGDSFPRVAVVRRWNISPDREHVASITYVPNGIEFLKGEVADWHIWVKTPSDVGVSNCGYGFLYKVAQPAILIRNNSAYNATYNELFGMPIKIVKTNKHDQAQLDQAQAALQSLGAAAGAIIGLEDEMEFIEAKSGSGYKSYADFELRQEKKISKIILGHSDVIDSIPGKLGASQKGQGNDLSSPTAMALSEVQSKDGKFVEHYINEELIPRLINFGFNIPDDTCFKFLNDDEDMEERRKQFEISEKVASIAADLAKGGIELDPTFVEQITGLKTIKKIIPINENL